MYNFNNGSIFNLKEKDAPATNNLKLGMLQKMENLPNICCSF